MKLEIKQFSETTLMYNAWQNIEYK